MPSKPSFPIDPPIEPMLAKLPADLPAAGDFLFEPKWDGFRAIVFRGDDDLYIQSREPKPLDRYFPELHDALLAGCPRGALLDGEIVIVTAAGLDFDALQQRIHPAASRVGNSRGDAQLPLSPSICWRGGETCHGGPQRERRQAAGRLMKKATAPAPPDAGDGRPGHRGASGSSSSRAPAWTA